MDFKILLTAITTFLLLSNLVLAIPGQPHQFYGTVTINGNPTPDGTSIVAKINGIEVASTTTTAGKYGYSPIFYVDDPYNIRSGEEISFFVNGVNTGKTTYFCNGCIGVGIDHDPLNLAITVETGGEPSQPSGGGGGGGGGYFPPSGTNETEEETTEETGSCEVRWLCTDWSECKDGEQTRDCEDVNKCGTDYGKPIMTQPCSTEEIKEASQVGPTAFFLLSSTDWMIGAVVGIVAAIIIILLLRRRSSGRRKK